jgi:NTE family protein
LFSQNPPVREFAAGTDKAHTPDEIWVIRINPQKRDREPVTLGTIEGRRNELAGNLSLNQELRFIQTVNEWVALFEPLTKAKQKHPAIAAFAEYKPIKLYLITMARDRADLGVGTKFDRSPDFVSGMRRHGEERGSAFLPLWLSDSPDLVEWPNGDALDAIDRE